LCVDEREAGGFSSPSVTMLRGALLMLRPAVSPGPLFYLLIDNVCLVALSRDVPLLLPFLAVAVRLDPPPNACSELSMISGA